MRICIGLENPIPYVTLSSESVAKRVNYYDIDTGETGWELVTYSYAKSEYIGTIARYLPVITRRQWELLQLLEIVSTDKKHNKALSEFSWFGAAVEFDKETGLNPNPMYRTIVHYFLSCYEQGFTDMYSIDGDYLEIVVKYDIWKLKIKDKAKFVKIMMGY